MQTDLQKRILANVLLESHPKPLLKAQRQRISISMLVSLTLALTAIIGLLLLSISKLKALL